MQSSLLNSTLEDKNLSEIPNFRYVFGKFSTHEYLKLQVGCLSNVLLSYDQICLIFCRRLLLKQLVTMEVIQWTSLWNSYKDEFENEKNMLGGSLVDKAAEDLRQRIIEHVNLPPSCYMIVFTH